MFFVFSLSLLLTAAFFHLGSTTMALALLKPALVVLAVAVLGLILAALWLSRQRRQAMA